MPVKQRKTTVSVIPTTRFKSKVKSAGVKTNQSKCGYGVKTASNSQEGCVRKRTRPPVTKSRPGYSLYSTDSEEQIGEVDKGLTKCANIVKQMLEVRKGRSPRTATVPHCVSSQTRETTQIGSTSPRQNNRPPVVIPTEHGTHPPQRQPLFNKRLATSTPDPEKMENSTENLEKVAGYFRKTPSNPSTLKPVENVQGRLVQKSNPPQGQFLQEILNADDRKLMKNDQGVTTQQCINSPLHGGVPQAGVSQPLLYHESLAESQNFQIQRNQQDFQREIPPTARINDNNQVYSNNNVKSNFQSLEKDHQNTFIRPGPVLIDIPSGMENSLDESGYYQLPGQESLFQGYRGIQSVQSPHLQIASVNSDTMPVFRQSEGFIPQSRNEVSVTNSADSLQTSARNLTHTRFEGPLRKDSLTEYGMPKETLPSGHAQPNQSKPVHPFHLNSNTGSGLVDPFQKGKTLNQTFTSPEKQFGSTDGNTLGFNNVTTTHQTLPQVPQSGPFYQTKPIVNPPPFQTTQITNPAQAWPPMMAINPVEFQDVRSNNQSQFPVERPTDPSHVQTLRSVDPSQFPADPSHFQTVRSVDPSQFPADHHQSHFQAVRPTDLSQFQAISAVNPNLFQPGASANQAPVQAYNNQSYAETTVPEDSAQSQFQVRGYSNQNVFQQSMADVPQRRAYHDTVPYVRPNVPINHAPVMTRHAQGPFVSNVGTSEQQAPVYSSVDENPFISNPSQQYHGHFNPQLTQVTERPVDVRRQQNQFPIEDRGVTNMQMRQPVSVDYQRSRTIEFEDNNGRNITPQEIAHAAVNDMNRRAPYSQTGLLYSNPGPDIRAEIDKAMQPLLNENKQLRSNLRGVSEQMKDLEREWTNQQLRHKDVEKDSTNQRLFEAEKPLDSSGSLSQVQTLELSLEQERARADNLKSELQRCQPELEQYKNDRQKLLHVLQEKDAEKLRLRLSNLSEVRNLHTEVQLQQKQVESYRLKFEASEKEAHILQITLKQRDAEIDRLQELVLTMKTSMSELIQDQHDPEGTSHLAASFNLQRLERLLREGHPNSEHPDLHLVHDTIPFEPRLSGELSDDSSAPLTVRSLAEHNERSSLDAKTSKLKKDDRLCEEIENMNLFGEDLLSLDETVTETVTETTTTVTSHHDDSTISTIKDVDFPSDINHKNVSTPQKKTVHFDETNTAFVDGKILDEDLGSVHSDEPSRYSVTEYFKKYPNGATNGQKSSTKGDKSSNTQHISDESKENSGRQESSLKGDNHNPLSGNQHTFKKPPPRPPPPLRNPLISQDDDGTSMTSGLTYSSISTAATVDESVFRAGLADLDANIARLQESLQQKKASLSS